MTATNLNRNPPETFIAAISYSYVKGYHVFTSDQVEGLLVASKDENDAIKQLVPTIAALLDHNLGGDWQVSLARDLKDAVDETADPIDTMKSRYILATPRDIAGETVRKIEREFRQATLASQTVPEGNWEVACAATYPRLYQGKAESGTYLDAEMFDKWSAWQDCIDWVVGKISEAVQAENMAFHGRKDEIAVALTCHGSLVGSRLKTMLAAAPATPGATHE